MQAWPRQQSVSSRTRHETAYFPLWLHVNLSIPSLMSERAGRPRLEYSFGHGKHNRRFIGRPQQIEIVTQGPVSSYLGVFGCRWVGLVQFSSRNGGLCHRRQFWRVAGDFSHGRETVEISREHIPAVRCREII